MNTLNEKAVIILKAVIKETKLEGTYDALYLSDALRKFWDNCRSFTLGWTDLAEEIGRQERYLLASGFTQDEIDDIRFDAAFEGMMQTIK